MFGVATSLPVVATTFSSFSWFAANDDALDGWPL